MQFTRKIVFAVLFLFQYTSIVRSTSSTPLSSYSEFVYITGVIDAESVYKDFKHKSPSKNPANPTQIDHSYGYLITERKYVVNNTQATADLIVKAKTGDSLRFSAISESNNFEQVVILYSISESECWTPPQFVSNYQRYMPFPTDKKLTNYTTEIRKYVILSVNLLNACTVSYKVRFILYERLDLEPFQEKPFNIFGYFEWDPTIIITY